MMNTKLILSGLSIVTAMALMAGGTFAYFSSTATSTGNAFSTGTLNLQIDDNNESAAATVTASFGNTLLPGGTTTGFVSLHNNGTIDMAKIKFSATETTASSPDLATVLQFTSVKLGDDNACTTNVNDITSALTTAIGGNTLSKLNGNTYALPGLTASATRYLCITFTLDPNTGDTFQGKSIAETFTFEGDQTSGQ